MTDINQKLYTYYIIFDLCEELIKDTVPKQCKNNEVDRRPHARLNPSLRSNPIVHHFVPVLSSQDLRKHTPEPKNVFHCCKYIHA